MKQDIIIDSEPKEKKKYQRKRDIFIRFMVDEDEREMIHRKMARAGINNMRAYLLKMAIDGKITHIELESVREMVRLLSNATNCINQIAKRVNEQGSFYAADLADLQIRYEEIWTQTKEILKELSDI